MKSKFRFDYQAIKTNDPSLGGAMGKEEGLTEKGKADLKQLAFPILPLEKYRRLLMRVQVMEIQQLKQEWIPLHETMGGVVDRHLNALLDVLDESQQELLISSLLVEYTKFLYGPAISQEPDMLDPARYAIKRLEEQIKQNIPALQHFKFPELNSGDKKILSTTSKKMRSLSKHREPIQARINSIQKASAFSEFADLSYCSLDEFCIQLASEIGEKWFDKKEISRVQGMLKTIVLMNYVQHFKDLQAKGIVNDNPDEEYFLKDENIYFSPHFKQTAFSFLMSNVKSFLLSTGELRILTVSSSLDVIWRQYEPVYDLQISPRMSFGGSRRSSLVHKPALRHFSNSNCSSEISKPSPVPPLKIDLPSMPLQVEDPSRTQSARGPHDNSVNPRAPDFKAIKQTDDLVSDFQALQIDTPPVVTFSEDASRVSGGPGKKISPRILVAKEIYESFQRQNSLPNVSRPKPFS